MAEQGASPLEATDAAESPDDWRGSAPGVWRARWRGLLSGSDHRLADGAIGTLIAASLLAVVLAIAGPLTPEQRQFLSDFAMLPLGLVSSALAWWASGRFSGSRRARLAWRLLAVALLCTWLGDGSWFVLEALRHVEPSPSIGDVAYLAFYPMLVLAAFAFPTAPSTRSQRIQATVDTLVVIASGTLVIWYVLLRPLAGADLGDPVSSALAIAYPVGDLALVFVVARLGTRRPGGLARPALVALVAALLFTLAADVAYGILALEGAYEGGKWPDLLYALSWVCLALTGYLQVRNGPRSVPSSDPLVGRPATLNLLPYGSLAISIVLVVAAAADRLGPELDVLVFGCLAVVGLVVFRQLLAIREHNRLVFERAVETSEAHFRSLIQNSTDLITVVDPDTTIRYQTPSIETLLGYTAEELQGTRLADIVHPDDLIRLSGLVDEAISSPGITPTVELRLRDHDGTWVYVETIGANQLADPQLRGVVLNTRDLRERKALEAELTHRAFHDPLTNLANRALFRDRVEHALARARRSGTGLAVLFLDLDNFKTINDSLGHGAGDQVLVECAGRLRTCLRLVDTPARFGGDEFAVLLEDVTDPHAASIVADHVTDALRVPFAVDGQEIFLSASIGIATSLAGAETSAELLRNADVAMYTAKEHGKGRAELYQPAMHAAVLARLALESELRRGLERSEFVVHYQPIVRLDTRRIVGFEALVRWNHPVRGLLPPEDFLPLAEETGMIIQIGGWVLRDACAVLHALQEAHPGMTPLSMSVNVSRRQLQAGGLLDEVAIALDASGVRAASLTLEVSESVLMDDTQAVAQRLRDVRALGVRVAIDDFGTGYSSLSYLRDFPVDMVKIDRSFIGGLMTAAGQAAITQGIVELGRAMHFQTVAEGIEQVQQVVRLTELGCDLGQGFHFAHPLESAELEALLVAQGEQDGRPARAVDRPEPERPMTPPREAALPGAVVLRRPAPSPGA